MQIEALNIARLREAESLHAHLLEDVREVNRKYLAEHEVKVKARKVSRRGPLGAPRSRPEGCVEGDAATEVVC